MSLVTLAQAREHIETDLVDDAVQRLLDDADAEIIARLGALATETEVLDGGKIELLHLSRKASSITSAVERIREQDYTLAADDYGLLSDGFRVERRQGATYPATRWSGRVTIVYVPVSQSAQRVRLEIDLVKLAVQYQALAASSVGDVRVQSLNDYQAEREKLFRSLLTSARRWFA